MTPDYGVLGHRQANCETCGQRGWRYGAHPTNWRHDWRTTHPFVPLGTHPWVAAAVLRWRRMERDEVELRRLSIQAEARRHYHPQVEVFTHEIPDHRDLEAS